MREEKSTMAKQQLLKPVNAIMARVASHVFLNWTWIKNTMLKKSKSSA
jgi:hypothetical protein